jgi:hypothetical protein
VAHVARLLNVTPTTNDGMTVGVENGERLPYLEVCSALSFSIHGLLFYIDFLIITLESYELMPVCNWLRTLGPIIWDINWVCLFLRHLLSPTMIIYNYLWQSLWMSLRTTWVYRLHDILIYNSKWVEHLQHV